MITWLTGNTGAGKTAFSKEFKRESIHEDRLIILDGDEVREVWPDIGLSKEDRWENNLRVARLAALLHLQGFEVVVAVICPYEKLRQEVQEICACRFIYMPDGHTADEEHPYEVPSSPSGIIRKADFIIKE